MAILERKSTRKSKKTGEPITKVRYQVMIDVDDIIDPETGALKRRRQTVGTYRTSKEAKAAERDAVTARDRGTLLPPDTTTVATLLDRFLAEEVPKRVAPENRQEYRNVVERHLKPALGQHKVRRLTVQHVDVFYASLTARGFSPSLVRKCHQRLNGALGLAVRWKIVSRNILDDVKPPKMTTKPGRVWTPGQAARFLAVAREAGDPLTCYWTLMLDTGGRTSEILGLRWDDVDLDRGTVRLAEQVIRLLGGKPVIKVGGKSAAAQRTPSLTAGTVDLLREHRRAWVAARLASTDPEWNPHGLVFVTRSGRPLNARNVRRNFDALVKRAGVPAISPHDVRRTSITSAMEAGAPLKAVQARAGHSDPHTTIATYVKVTGRMGDDLNAVMEALMNATPDPPKDAADAG